MVACTGLGRHRVRVAALRRDFPNDATAHFLSAYLFRLDGDYANSLRCLATMLRINPGERAVVVCNRARIAMYQGRHEEARQTLEQELAQVPQHLMLQIFRAITIFYNGNPALAARIWRALMSRHPQEMEGFRPHFAICLSTLGSMRRPVRR